MPVLIYISLIILLIVLIVLTIYGIIVLSDLRRAISEFQRTTIILNERLPTLLDNINDSTKDLRNFLDKARGNLTGFENLLSLIAGLVSVGARGKNIKRGFLYSFTGAIIGEILNTLLKKKKKD
jgi:predicted PurR-regulated permease PerM